MADFLGFYESIKTDLNEKARHREFTENQIYQDIENCQDFGSYDLDPTKTLERRQAFKKSIIKLHNLTLAGVEKSERYVFWSEEPTAFSSGRIYGDADEIRLQPYVIQIRKLAVKIIQALREKYTSEEVAAIMLATALDAAHKVVLTVSVHD
jgi:sensor domain CHASE-containing protein